MTLTPAAPTATRHGRLWCPPRAGRSLAVASTTVGALVSWTVSRYAGGVDMVVGSGSTARTVTALSVLVVSLLAGAAAVGLAAVLSRWARRPRRTWTVVTTTALVLSLLGPLGAASVTAFLALASLHLIVGAGLIVGIRWSLPEAPAARR